MEQTYFRRGFGLKKQVQPLIDAEYHSGLVERIRARGHEDVFGDVTVRLAQEFGFCYGVDRAIDYAYETVRKFPGKRIYLVGEIIHNPHVNQRMREMGIRFLYPRGDKTFDFSKVTAQDVVLIPRLRNHAPGLRQPERNRLRPGRYHVRLRAQRVEAGRDVRPRRIHRHRPRQVHARGVARHRVAGHHARRGQVPDRPQHGGGGGGVRLHRAPSRQSFGPGVQGALPGEGHARFRPGHGSAQGRGGEPDHHAGERVPRDRRPDPRGDGGGTRRGVRRGALPLLRHDLLGDPEEAGRGGGDDGPAPGRHDRGGRLQLVQHQPPGRHVPRVHPDLPHRGRGVHRRGHGRRYATSRSSTPTRPK